MKNQGLLCGCDPPQSSLPWLSGSRVWPGALRLWSKPGGEKEGARRSREQQPCHCLAPSVVMPSWGWETFASVVLLWAVNKNILQMSDARLRNQKGIFLSLCVCLFNGGWDEELHWKGQSYKNAGVCMGRVEWAWPERGLGHHTVKTGQVASSW